ncbi:universal stress protein family domain containing protein [Niveomyces insectorum RCEF 264]|uniref:Universal stress protein family domain containing protein n=1 Tax=Niveomyces insectorum RCEF 264 TaxID=1081102 RepID=A0A167ZYW9_9HYPO|nr:universal stress protein family domain containing protein [Niveomyces insectorum RCEF 264]
MSRKPMSMEAVMDEERLEVLELLKRNRPDQGYRSPSATRGGRSASPYTSNPRSPIRSMLDFAEDDLDAPAPAPRASASGPANAAGANRTSPRIAPAVRSMLDIGDTAKTPIRSMLDVDSPPMAHVQPVFSAQTSPTEPNHRIHPPAIHRHHSGNTVQQQQHHPRSMSDASARPVEFGPRMPLVRSDRVDPTADYQFSDIITNRQNPMATKRATQAVAHGPTAPNKRGAANSMAELMRGNDLGSLKLPGHTMPLHGRTSTSGGRLKSKSPHNRLSGRSKSPHLALTGRTLSPAGRAFLEKEQVDMQTAYRRLSDANLVRSGGSLSGLPLRKRSDETGSSGSRLTKDYLSPDGEEILEDSSDDANVSSSDDDGDDDDDELNRGRKAARAFPGKKMAAKSPSSPVARKDGKQPLSLLAAAEEERIQVASSQPAYQYRSLLDEPEITVTNPSGDKAKPMKPTVHPSSSFDVPSRSASRAPWDSDDEAEYTDIKSAQKLPVTMTPIMSNPEIERSIRIIYRGDFAKVQKEATEEEHRRLRKYLVATDLSDESTHALEWAVGTVLRDGDTLVAIYCVDEETGIPGGEGQDEPKTTREQAAAVSATTTTGWLPNISSATALATAATSTAALSVAATPLSSRPSMLMRNSESTPELGTSSPVLPLQRERTKAEEDRFRAVQDIADRITRLLRKTRLQVRVIVEVLHCKNPRHLITEVIDLVNPTLVILGSRGRSALKGVILGSFSNYLVTKSSVPVMVARKRLRKQSKYKRPPVQQVNNLNDPTSRSLANAKVD